MIPPESRPPTAAGSDDPVFDASVLGAMFGNAPELVASVLQTFVASTHANLAELAQALAAQNISAVAALAHKVAGASRMSGAIALGHSARSLEEAAKQGDRAALTRGMTDLEAQWTLVQATIASQTDLS